MSNSGFVIPKRKLPKFERLDKLVRKTVGDRFPLFAIETIDREGWLIKHKDVAFSPYMALQIWVSKHGRRRALQFPHRHSYNCLWWIEYEIRERLAAALDAKQYDEGTGDCENCSEFYATYSDYLRGVYGDHYKNQMVVARLELDVLPLDMTDMMGDEIIAGVAQLVER